MIAARSSGVSRARAAANVAASNDAGSFTMFDASDDGDSGVFPVESAISSSLVSPTLHWRKCKYPSDSRSRAMHTGSHRPFGAFRLRP